MPRRAPRRPDRQSRRHAGGRRPLARLQQRRNRRRHPEHVVLAAEGRHDTLGAFNLYADAPRAFSDTDEEDTSRFVTQAAVVLANARAYWRVFELADGLRTAMISRAEIEQAKGIIMASARCSADEAFGLLRQQSQQENRKLRDVARELASTQKR